MISGPIQGKVFEFDKHDTFVFGRGKECHARLPKDPRVSRHHFLLEVNPPEATIRDLRSLNGTHVNGVRYGGRRGDRGALEDGRQPASQTVLKDRDLIMVGKTRIRVRVADQRAGSADGGQSLAAAQNGLYVPTNSESPAEDSSKAEARREGNALPPPILKPTEPPRPSNGPFGALVPSAAEEVGGVQALIRQAAKDFQSRHEIEVEGYELREILGQGGMGVVYKAVRKLDQFPVAVKVMLAKAAVHDKSRQRFLREIDIIRELNHDNIVALISSGAVQNAFYFVTEYCNGGSLSDLACRQGGRVPLQSLVPIVLQSLKGLAYAHQHGFVHRDIKPANILLHQHQRGWEAKLSDFGLAKQFEQAGFSGMTLTGATGGTYDYMPREQLTDFKKILPVSDVWSMAATFYRALTGTSPRPCLGSRDPMEVVLRDKHLPVRQRDPSLSPPLAQVIDKSLAIDAVDRYQNAGEMYRALNEALS